MVQTFFYRFSVVILLYIAFFFNIQTVFAADPKPVIKDETYQATFVSQSESDPIVITAGETKTITLKFRNSGQTTWQATGARYVSAYTVEPRERESVFYTAASWVHAHQTSPITAATKPGQIATLRLDLTAPDAPGEYTEQFYLAAENHSWIQGGYFFLKIIVKAAPKKAVVQPAVQPVTEIPTQVNTPEYRAKRFMQNTSEVSVKGGDRVRFIVGFQNTGSETWKSYTLRTVRPTALAQVSPVTVFADDGWKDTHTVRAVAQEVRQFDVVREDVYFRAPSTKGTYTLTFYLTADDVVLGDAEATVQVTVTEDAPEHYQEPVVPIAKEDAFVVPSSTSINESVLPTEPRIRVGLWKTNTFVQFRSEEDDYDVFDGEVWVGVLSRGTLGVLNYVNGTYSFSGGDLLFETTSYIRLSPVNNPHAVFEIINWKRSLGWKGPKNFNMYRGALEYRMTQDTTALYVINDLLFEDYVKGISENSNGAPIEYLKAQSVAQRTYAYYIANHSDKHDKRNFDVVASTGDQLYGGYESELLMSNFVAAVEATRGYLVTYDREVVITPYFAHSDGRTRSWQEVWGGGKKPWLVSVKATYDKKKYKKMLGHGVGMSQIDASLRAKNEGVDWQTLLKYYYSGVDIEKRYQ